MTEDAQKIHRLECQAMKDTERRGMECSVEGFVMSCVLGLASTEPEES